jgi:hypothetical protein
MGAREKRWRHGEAERLRSLEIDHELKLGRCLHRQVDRLFAPENAVGINRRLAEQIVKVNALMHQASLGGEGAQCVDCGQPVASCEFAMRVSGGVRRNDNAVAPLARKRGQRSCDLR